MILITSSRLRSILSECRTEADLQATLRYHRIKFKYDTTPGYLSLVIPTATGAVRVTKTASKTAPFAIGCTTPEPYERPKHLKYHYETC